MKGRCEKCLVVTKASRVAYLCSYERTFCESCMEAVEFICPNGSGGLVRRPARLEQPVTGGCRSNQSQAACPQTPISNYCLN